LCSLHGMAKRPLRVLRNLFLESNGRSELCKVQLSILRFEPLISTHSEVMHCACNRSLCNQPPRFPCLHLPVLHISIPCHPEAPGAQARETARHLCGVIGREVRRGEVRVKQLDSLVVDRLLVEALEPGEEARVSHHR